MLDFFKGWRRKAGCGLLFAALFVTGCWVRSYHPSSLTQIGYGRMHLLHSTGGDIRWMSWNQPAGERQFAIIFLPELRAEDLSKMVEQMHADLIKNKVAIRESIVPYWRIAIPLTLLSAYLLLWPGKRPAKPPSPN